MEEEAEFINAYQEMVGKAKEIEEELKQQGEEPLKTEEEWEREIETAAYFAEQLYESAKEIENASTGVDELEIEKEAEQSAEISEPQLSNSKEEISELEELADMIEQHQVEPFIEEALETKPEPIVNEKEIEKLQEMDIEEQFKTVHDNEYLEELIESQNEKIELETEGEAEAQLNNSKENFSELETELEEERDEIEQHQVEAAIEEELEAKPEPIVNDEVIEEIQEIQGIELEEQFQTVNFNEYIEELVENQEEEKIQEHNKREQEREQEQENIEQTQTQEVIQQSTYLQEQLEEQEQNIEQEYEDIDEVEQHQVETAIEEELETEPKPIIQEEELEYIKNFEPEKQLEAELLYELIEELAQKQKEVKKEIEEKEEQNDISTEQKVAQIKRKLQIPQENSAETEVEVVNKEVNITLVEPKQEEQEEEYTDENSEKNYETAKSRYKQQTGKRPIYANKETKGFKQWLEQSKESKEEEKTKQIQEPKEERKKEESWKSTLKNWIEQATEIEPELKSELKKLVEKYNELEKLIKKYKQLYNKAKSEELSQNEMVEFTALNKMLLKIDPIKIEMFLDLRDIKRYLNEKYFYDFWDKPRVNQIRTHFFTHISQQYKNVKLAQKKKENLEQIIDNWIDKSSENEISSELKLKLKEVVKNYAEIEKVATKFMKLYTKSQHEKLSKTEKIEFQSLIRTLQKSEPSKIELFAGLRAIKNYLNDQNSNDFSDKTGRNRIFSVRNNFFKLISQKYENLKKENKVKKLIKTSERFKTPLEYLVIGQHGHIALGLLMYRSLINLNLKYFYEPQLYSPFNQKHPDGTIVITKEFLSFFGDKFQKYLNFTNEEFSQIRHIIFDFTLNTDKINVMEKISKYNPNDASILIIIGLNWKLKSDIGSLPNDDLIYQKNYKNIRIVNQQLWTKLFNLDKDNLWNDVIDAILDKNLVRLKSISKKLKLNFSLPTTYDLKEFLKSDNLFDVFINDYDRKLLKIVPDIEDSIVTNKSLSYFEDKVLLYGNSIDAKRRTINFAQKLISLAYSKGLIKQKCKSDGYVAVSLYLAGKYLNDFKTQEQIFKRICIHENTFRKRLEDFHLFQEVFEDEQLKLIYKGLGLSLNLINSIKYYIKLFRRSELAENSNSRIYYYASIVYLVSKTMNNLISRTQIAEMFRIDRSSIKLYENNLGIKKELYDDLWRSLIDDYSEELEISAYLRIYIIEILEKIRDVLKLDEKSHINYKSYVLAGFYLIMNHLDKQLSYMDLLNLIKDRDLAVSEEAIRKKVSQFNFIKNNLINIKFKHIKKKYFSKLHISDSESQKIFSIINQARETEIIDDDKIFRNNIKVESFFSAVVYYVLKFSGKEISKRFIAKTFDVHVETMRVREIDLKLLFSDFRISYYNELIDHYFLKFKIANKLLSCTKYIVRIGNEKELFPSDSNVKVDIATAIYLASIVMNYPINQAHLSKLLKIDRSSIINRSNSLNSIKEKIFGVIQLNHIFQILDIPSDVRDLTSNLIKQAFQNKDFEINNDFKSYIASAIYVAGKYLKKKITQEMLSKKLNISRHTIINYSKIFNRYLS